MDSHCGFVNPGNIGRWVKNWTGPRGASVVLRVVRVRRADPAHTDLAVIFHAARIMAELAHGDDNVAQLMGEDLIHPAWNVLAEGHDERGPRGPRQGASI